eukprot:362101_1
MAQCANCQCAGATSRCGGCRLVWYCNKDCQRKHWKFHKKQCKFNINKNQHHKKSSAQANDNNLPYKKYKKYTNKNIIYEGFVSINHQQSVFLMTLPENSTILCLYNSIDKNFIKLINVKTFKTSISYTSTNINSSYGLRLEKARKTDNDCQLFFDFKKKNERFEWMTHIEYIINNQAEYKEQTIQDDEKKDRKKVQMTGDSLSIINKVLDLYESSTKDGKEKSLSKILKQHLNVNYSSILNHFNAITLKKNVNANANKSTTKNKRRNKNRNKCMNNYNDRNKANKLCTNTECEYVRRHCATRINVQNNDKDIHDYNDEILRELLDKIHCCIYHNQPIIRENISNKFVIHTKNSNNDDNKNNDDVSDIQDKNTLFAFGMDFTYYEANQTAQNYIKPKYGSLFEELASNPYYKLTQQQLNRVYLKSLQIKKSNRFKQFKANDCGPNNRNATIDIGDPISINHIIALLTYCNEDKLQRIFKKHTRQLSVNESPQNILTRQSYIAHWTRYLKESCSFYGEYLKPNEVVYCGVDSKLLFNTLCFENYSPLSTTTDIMVGQKFATNNGIILKLKRNHPINCKYFDMMLLSDFIQEKERFFCGNVKLKILDIFINGDSNKNSLTALKLLESILNGSLFYYSWNKSLYDSVIQGVLINLLNCYVEKTNDNDE